MAERRHVQGRLNEGSRRAEVRHSKSKQEEGRWGMADEGSWKADFAQILPSSAIRHGLNKGA